MSRLPDFEETEKQVLAFFNGLESLSAYEEPEPLVPQDSKPQVSEDKLPESFADVEALLESTEEGSTGPSNYRDYSAHAGAMHAQRQSEALHESLEDRGIDPETAIKEADFQKTTPKPTEDLGVLKDPGDNTIIIDSDHGCMTHIDMVLPIPPPIDDKFYYKGLAVEAGAELENIQYGFTKAMATKSPQPIRLECGVVKMEPMQGEDLAFCLFDPSKSLSYVWRDKDNDNGIFIWVFHNRPWINPGLEEEWEREALGYIYRGFVFLVDEVTEVR